MAVWKGDGYPVDPRKLRPVRGAEWVGEARTPEPEPPIQCYDPPEIMAICHNCPLPDCKSKPGRRVNGNAGRCPLIGLGKAGSGKGYKI